MSLGVYPVFEAKSNGARFEALGEVLAANFETLDNIARFAGLTPFTAFADNRPIPDVFDGDPDDLDEMMGEWSEWFDAADGRAAICALAEYIKTNPSPASVLDDFSEVVAELDELARVLGVATVGACASGFN